MSTTNSRVLRDPSDDGAEGFTDLPDPRKLALDDNVTVGNAPTKRKRQEANDDLPGEFAGKSAAELAKMLTDKESMIGRQSQEIGHLRDLSDQLLRSQLASAHNTANSSSTEPEEVQVSGEDILERPVDAIRKVIKPMLDDFGNEIRGAVGGLQASSAAEQFAKRHPTYQQDMTDPGFQTYVQKSNYRIRLAQKAHSGNDFEAADELWSGWEEAQAAKADPEPLANREDANANKDDDATRRKALNDASTVRAGGESGASAGKPIYSARKIQEMRNSDPDGYYSPAFQKLLLEAYRDNRVR